MTKELAEQLKPILNNQASGVFAIGDGSGRWFCAACGAIKERIEMAQMPGMMALMDFAGTQIEHAPTCNYVAKNRAMKFLAKEIAEAA